MSTLHTCNAGVYTRCTDLQRPRQELCRRSPEAGGWRGSLVAQAPAASSAKLCRRVGQRSCRCNVQLHLRRDPAICASADNLPYVPTTS